MAARPNIYANTNQSAGTSFSSILAALGTAIPNPFATPVP
jgi:hypothetical protein